MLFDGSDVSRDPLANMRVDNTAKRVIEEYRESEVSFHPILSRFFLFVFLFLSLFSFLSLFLSFSFI
jgi:hypothetical protein